MLNRLREFLREWLGVPDPPLPSAAQETLDLRDARDVADAELGMESIRDRVVRNEHAIQDIGEDVDAADRRADVSEDRANDSEQRETEWSLHRDHAEGDDP